MELNELQAFLEREVSYPANGAAVRAAVGDAEIAAPNDEDSETIATLLDVVDAGTYSSADELHEALLSQLPDEYIGRKFYDDRGGSSLDSEPMREDDRDRSF